MYSPVPLDRIQYTMNNNKRINRKKPSRGIRGNGDYSISTQNIGKPLPRLEAKLDHIEKMISKKSNNSLASQVGRTVGNLINQGDLGAIAGSSMAKLFGHGDYSVKGNSLISGHNSSPIIPKFSKDGPRGTRFVEREFITNITAGELVSGNTDFKNDAFNLTPTNSNLFPWLSKIAPLYDQWEPHGLVLEFVSTSSEFNGTSQALGTLVMATDYDPYDTLFVSKQEMENSDYACATKPSLSLIHGVECAVKERPTRLLYTSLSTEMPRTSQTLGTFQIASQGCSTAHVTLGELWISYDITFYKKQIIFNPPPVPTPTISNYLQRFSTLSTTGDQPLFPSSAYVNYSNVITRTDVLDGTRFSFNNSDTSTTVLREYRILVKVFSPTVLDESIITALTAVADPSQNFGIFSVQVTDSVNTVGNLCVAVWSIVVNQNNAYFWFPSIYQSGETDVRVEISEVISDYLPFY